MKFLVIFSAILRLSACGETGSPANPTFANRCADGLWAPEDFRLFVAHDQSANSSVGRINEAIAFWNAPVSFPLFIEGGVADTDTAAGALIVIDMTNTDRGEAEVERRACKVISARIHLPVGRDSKERIAHELGHVLGLAHDEAHESIMNPNTIAGKLIRPEDLRAIEDAYGRRPSEGSP